ncbi:hypothetical protein BJV77DRAFT_719377 [Russula vinacea]|nr:hypothetical protein BJV77DRAFT_719377 [Russula vinacea]
MPRRASASTARPAAAAAATATASSSSSSTTIVANSTAVEEGSAAAAGPSSKTLPAGFSAAASPSASASASKSGDGTQVASASRPRRIMPSRSRRGGPGVGISDVDTHILETLRRRRENEPLIPAHAQFLLTTNSTRVRTFGESSKGATDAEGGSQLNTCAYERYFDKPEVIHAYREQQLIQTPEFTLLPEQGLWEGGFDLGSR